MAETDNPLKRLVEVAISDFAAWLLGVEVQDAYAVNIELTSNLVRVDQLFRVTLQNGRTTLLHIEFQGSSTHRPMKWRMLEYMARIADAEPELDLFSVVFYVGVGLALRTQVNTRSIHLVIQQHPLEISGRSCLENASDRITQIAATRVITTLRADKNR